MASAAAKIVSKNAGRIFLPFRLHTILPAFAVLFNSDGRPVFREAHFDILRVLNQSEKLLIAFHLCLLCVLNAYYGNNAYCVRIKGVLEIEQSWTRCRYLQQVKYENFVAVKYENFVDNLTKAIYNDYACYHGVFV